MSEKKKVSLSAATIKPIRGAIKAKTRLKAGLLTEIGFPACDGAAKDAAYNHNQSKAKKPLKLKTRVKAGEPASFKEPGKIDYPN
jgi:hypothetical protein